MANDLDIGPENGAFHVEITIRVLGNFRDDTGRAQDGELLAERLEQVAGVTSTQIVVPYSPLMAGSRARTPQVTFPVFTPVPKK